MSFIWIVSSYRSNVSGILVLIIILRSFTTFFFLSLMEFHWLQLMLEYSLFWNRVYCHKCTPKTKYCILSKMNNRINMCIISITCMYNWINLNIMSFTVVAACLFHCQKHLNTFHRVNRRSLYVSIPLRFFSQKHTCDQRRVVVSQSTVVSTETHVRWSCQFR